MRNLTLLSFLAISIFAANIGQASPVTSLAFSPDGKRVAAGGMRVVTLFEAQTGKALGQLKGHAGAINALAFSPDGKVLAAAGGTPGKFGEILLWNATTGKRINALRGHVDAIYGVAFQKNSKRLIAGSYDRLVSLWNLSNPTNVPEPKMLKDHTDAVYGVAFSPDGSRIASISGDRTLKIWDSNTGKRLFTLSESTAELYTVAFRPDGKQVCAGGADKTLRTWNLTPSGGTLAKVAFAHQGAVLRVLYSATGDSLLSAGEDNAVKRWDTATLAERKVYASQPDNPQALALSPNGQLLAVGCHNGAFTLYNAETGAALHSPESRAQRPTRFCAKPKQSGGATLFAASLGDMVPKGFQRGKTVRISLYGSRIHHATNIYFDDAGLVGKIVAPPDPNSKSLHVDVEAAPTTRIGLHRLLLQTPLGVTGSLTFSVGDWQEIEQAEPNDTTTNPQNISLPATLIGAIDKPGDTDLYRFEAQGGDEIVFEAQAQSLRSRLQPTLAILDSEGKLLAESAFRPGRADTLLGYHFPQAGKYLLRVRDFQNQNGADVHYRVNAGKFPTVTQVFPLGIGRNGGTLSLKGFNLGINRDLAIRRTELAPDATSYTLPAPPNSPFPLLGETQVHVSEGEEVLQAGGNTAWERAQLVPSHATINGRLWEEKPKAGRAIAHYFRFPAKKGQTLVFEVLARRRGSALDSQIEVLNAQGKPVERAVLRAVGQAEMVLNDRDSDSGALRLFTWDDFHINDYLLAGREVIQILSLPKGPDDDVQFRTYRGRRLGFFGTTPEFHSLGSTVYKVEVHPAGSKFSPNGYPLTRLTYKNDDGNALYGKDSYLEFTAPADGDYLVRLSDVRGQQGEGFPYRLLIRPPRPDFRINVSTLHPVFPQKGGAILSVDSERYDGFKGAIRLQMRDLPMGFTATETDIEAGENSALLFVSANATAITTPYSALSHAFLSATAKMGGTERTREVRQDIAAPLFTVLPNPDLVVTTDKREAILQPGQETVIEVRVDRNNGFSGRIPVDVRNLPLGVRVLDIGLNGVLITEGDRSRKFVLYCEPWVKPQTRPFYVVGNVEGAMGYAAPSLTLRIEAPRTARK